MKEWASSLIGIEDDWTPIQFDEAVVMFGQRIESMLEMRDKEGYPIHSLDELLADIPTDTDLEDIVAVDIDVYTGIPGIRARTVKGKR